jgi:hypothetical protein
VVWVVVGSSCCRCRDGSTESARSPIQTRAGIGFFFKSATRGQRLGCGVQVELDVFSVQNMKTILILAIASFHI